MVKVRNNLIVIENGHLSVFHLDDKQTWEIGRPAGNNRPDIGLYSTTISRKHGRFQNMDGIWFYMDFSGKNGTVYNNKRIKSGIHGRVKPLLLKDGDVLVFGGGEEAIINCKTVWAMFSEREYGESWRVADTKGYKELAFVGADRNVCYENPPKGTIVKLEAGVGIYMGDITYLCGNIGISGK